MTAAVQVDISSHNCAICGRQATVADGIVGAYLCDSDDCLSAAWAESVEGLSAGLIQMVGADPQVVVCCGPARFAGTITRVQRALALAGHVVVDYSVPVPGEPDLTDVQVRNLVARHDRAIGLADVVAVINPGGYIGTSTMRDVALADSLGKRVVWLVAP